MRGKNRLVRMGEQGQVQKSNGPDYQFIYEVSTVQDPKWWVGDTVELPDGRKFVYSLSAASCAASASGNGVEFTDTGAVAITTLSVAQSVLAGSGAIGSTTVEIPAASHAAFTKDQLRGGYAIIYNGTGNDVDFRQIIGNDASLINAALTIYIDAGVTQAITTSSKVEVFLNPYATLQHATSSTLAKAGIPAASSLVTAASIYFWTQTTGMCWAVPHSALVGANGGMGCFWRQDGSIESTTTALGVTVAATDLSQYAGHTIAGTESGNGPLFCLNGS